MSQNFQRFVILCKFWDIPSENTGVLQLQKVSSAFTMESIGSVRVWYETGEGGLKREGSAATYLISLWATAPPPIKLMELAS